MTIYCMFARCLYTIYVYYETFYTLNGGGALTIVPPSSVYASNKRKLTATVVVAILDIDISSLLDGADVRA